MLIEKTHSVDPTCNYHTIKSVKAPKPPVYKTVTFKEIIRDEDICGGVTERISGKTMRVEMKRVGGVRYAYVPGALIDPHFFTVRRK